MAKMYNIGCSSSSVIRDHITTWKEGSVNKSDIPLLSATELSRLIEGKEVSPVEATEAYLERIDDIDFKFNAYLTVCRKEARRAAQEAEMAINRGGYLGPMHGMPVAVKDQLWSKGVRTTVGSFILRDHFPVEDATVVANLKKAGAILLGKLNLTEFAMALPQRFSTVRNPWNLDMQTGGSSSGSAAATAARLCATSLGEDTGGSIRWPSAWCGLVGFKPTWGRVSRYGCNRGVWSMDTVGPMSRSVEDAAITLGAIAGYDPNDPYTWNIPVPDYRKALDGNISGIKVGVIKEKLTNAATESETKEAVVKATSVLEELGASVDEVSVPLVEHDYVLMLISLLLEPADNQKDWVKERLQDYGFDTRVGILTGSIVPALAFYKAQKLRSMLRQQVHEASEKYDVLVSPTAGKPAQSLVQYDEGMARDLLFLHTSTYNLANAPAITVPCGFTHQGLPIGLQIGGRPGADETVLKVAHAYEQSTTWHTVRPPNA